MEKRNKDPLLKTAVTESFWMKVFIAAIRKGHTAEVAAAVSDKAIEAFVARSY